MLVIYGEGQRAWNTIRLKKEILQEFPQLKKRREKFAYKLTLCHKFKEVRESIDKMERAGLPVPFLMLFGKKS